MRLGVDIDGVLTDIEQFELDYGSKYYLTKTGHHLDKPNGYGSDQIFDANNEEDCNFWGESNIWLHQRTIKKICLWSFESTKIWGCGDLHNHKQD